MGEEKFQEILEKGLGMSCTLCELRPDFKSKDEFMMHLDDLHSQEISQILAKLTGFKFEGEEKENQGFSNG